MVSTLFKVNLKNLRNNEFMEQKSITEVAFMNRSSLLIPNHSKREVEDRKRDFSGVHRFRGLASKSTKTPLIRCDSSGPLYPVNQSSPQVFLASIHSVWHQILGHLGDQVLKSLISNKFISCNKADSSALCHACQFEKQIKLPFSSSNTLVSSPFDIIHSDLWTSHISSISGLRYYVIFLDHLTCCMGVFVKAQI